MPKDQSTDHAEPFLITHAGEEKVIIIINTYVFMSSDTLTMKILKRTYFNILYGFSKPFKSPERYLGLSKKRKQTA